MKKVNLLAAFLVFTLSLNAQTYMEITDNMEIPSNSWIKILGGEYQFSDAQWDGVIKIVGKENIILDGDSVLVQGTSFLGYMIDIQNSSNILIKNFDLVNNFKYAVRCLNSDHIAIEANNFSYNKKDTLGWIQIWTGYTAALGGGVLFYNSNNIDVHDNLMTQQNDGVALYQCDTAMIYNNVMNWNCGFGVRLNFTDNCWVHHNDLSHVNRETDPSDCAAILLIVSNHNLVEYNDLSYSGDGVFLGQYQYSQIPNNNQFYHNYCDFSPHNAIEATFADGNIYRYNSCNYSMYGFWLGYSFNSFIDSNEVIGNQTTGIAIDRGFGNTLTRNIIKENPVGLDLWEGDNISGYENQFSHDYFIYNNLFEGNDKAIQAKKTEHLVAKDNHFLNNRSDFYFEGDSYNDTITSNKFEGTATFYLENHSADDIYAVENDFIWNDSELIECKIFDKTDLSSVGEVIWQPSQPGIEPYYEEIPPDDMAEPPAQWYAYPEACWGYGRHEPTYVEWDYNTKKVGEAAIHLHTANGWDMGLMYRPGDGSIPSWNLTNQDSLVLWIRSANSSPYGFQYCHIRLGNSCGGYFKYTASASSILNPTIGQWKYYKISLIGGGGWSRSVVGEVDLSEISYVEFHADTWDHGFDLWLDGVSFSPYVTSINEKISGNSGTFNLSPNPCSTFSTATFTLDQPGNVSLAIYNCNGSLVRNISETNMNEGTHQFFLDSSGLEPGVYYVIIKSSGLEQVKKMAVIR